MAVIGQSAYSSFLLQPATVVADLPRLYQDLASIHSLGANSHFIKCGSYAHTLRPLVGKRTRARTVSH